MNSSHSLDLNPQKAAPNIFKSGLWMQRGLSSVQPLVNWVFVCKGGDLYI